MSDDLDLAWARPEGADDDMPGAQIAESRYVAGALYLIGPDENPGSDTWSLALYYASGDSVIWSNLPSEEDVKRAANEHDRGYRHQVERIVSE